MFKLKDGRTELWQWDINNFITVEDKSITQVHFYRDFIDNTIVVKVVEGEARIPDELLQKSGILEVYAITDNHTVVKESFTINMKVKPADYIYTPTEVKTWESKLDKSGWTPNKVLGTNEAGDVVPVEIKAEDVRFNDNDTFQDKFNNGSLKGEKGDKGDTGAKGADGAQGATGATGADGKDATINGVNALTIEQGENITLAQEGSKLTISAVGGGATADVPIATTQTAGKVKPDGTTITVAEDGTISATASGGGGGSFPLADRMAAAGGAGTVVIGDVSDTSGIGKNITNSLLISKEPLKLSKKNTTENSLVLNQLFRWNETPDLVDCVLLGSGDISSNYLDSCYLFGKAEFGNVLSNGFKSNIYSMGCGLKTKQSQQLLFGFENIPDNDNTYLQIIGNGDYITFTESNAFTLDRKGNGTYAGKVSSTGADYAEYFEWVDGNTEAADRVGYIVSLEGDKIKFANESDDVLGIISGTVGVLGDNYEWQWQGKYQTDEFGRVIYDMVEEFATTTDKDGNEVKYSLGMFPHPRIVSTFDANKEYVNRANRPEWDAVGMMGKLYVRDDGTAQIGGYVKPVEGIATASETKTRMRVMSRVSDNVIRVCLI